MEIINIHQAQTDFAGLLARVEMGEEIIISNQGVPVAKLVPFHGASNRLESLGHDQGLFLVPDDFNAPLPEEILVAFEGHEG